MSLEDEIRNSLIKDAQSFQEPSKKQSKTTYTRSFLLSLGELDVCKELPSGVDLSILSEFEEACQLQGGRQRNHGNLPLQSFRRSEYGSSPPTRGDSNNFTRGYGRWDNNSGSWNDRDSDTQSDKDSDTGWRPGNLSRRSSQTSEHDGLLGSGGSFPRTSSGYTAGLSASKSARPNDHYQLNKSNEPYHPPRPYKAVPHGRRETKDSFNDETFGSSESTSQDKMEDERRRRASFELMRKEQHKSLQESQKPDPDKHRDGQGSNISELLDDTSRDLKRPFGTSGVDEPVNPTTADSSKSSLQSQVSRPRVPPGFKSTTIPGKDSSSEVGISKVEESFSHGKAIGQNGNMDSSQVRQQTHIQNQQSEKTSAANNDKPSLVLSADPKLPSILDGSVTINGSGNLKYDMEQMTEHKASREMKQNGTSILEEILGTTSMLNIHGASNANEELLVKDDQESYDAAAVQSSKFAHWFIEDEKKTGDPSSYGRGNNLLSLIGVSDNNKVSDVKAATTQQQNMKEFPFLQASETSSFGFSSQGNTLPLPPPPNVVLTCEDLEQTILSEYGENSFIQKTTDLESWNPPTILSLDMQPTPTTTITTSTKADIIDNGASQHLLSLLQKGKGLQQQDVKQSYSFFNGSSTHDVSQEDVAPVENNKSLVVGGKSLTLETLFGSAFMEELQSVDAPVSAQRGGGSRRSDGPYGVIIDHENDALRLNHQQQRQQTKIGDDFEGSVDVLRLSKEQQQDDIFSHSVKQGPPMNRVTIYKDEQQPPPFGRLQQEMSIPYHHNNNFQQQKSPLVYPPPFLNPHDAHINHQQQHQPRVNSMENIHQDDDGHPPPHLPRMSQFPGGGNMMHQLLPSSHNHHSNAAARPTIRGGYDHHNLPFLHHQQMLQQQQQPPHMQRGQPHYPSGSGSNNNNQSSGFLHELNAMQQGFPFPHRPPPPNFNLGLGMHQQHSINNGLDVNAAASTGNGNMHSNNSHHSEAMKRLIEMELRANAKMQQGSSMFGHDLDLAGFRYR